MTASRVSVARVRVLRGVVFLAWLMSVCYPRDSHGDPAVRAKMAHHKATLRELEDKYSQCAQKLDDLRAAANRLRGDDRNELLQRIDSQKMECDELVRDFAEECANEDWAFGELARERHRKDLWCHWRQLRLKQWLLRPSAWIPGVRISEGTSLSMSMLEAATRLPIRYDCPDSGQFLATVEVRNGLYRLFSLTCSEHGERSQGGARNSRPRSVDKRPERAPMPLARE